MQRQINKNIIFLLCCLFFIIIFSQEKIIGQIDTTELEKFVYVYSIEQPTDEINTFFETKIKDSISEQYVLNFLLKNKYSINGGKRDQTRRMFGVISLKFRNKEIKKEALFHYVDMSFISHSTSFCFTPDLFNTKTIKRIIEIINQGPKQSELELKKRSNIYRFATMSSVGRKKVEKLKMKYNCNFDSAFNILASEYSDIKININDVHTINEYIKTIGFLKLLDYAPELERLLRNKKFDKSKKNIELSLARLNYKKYQKLYIKKYLTGEKFSVFNNHDLWFIEDVNFIWEYVNKNNSKVVEETFVKGFSDVYYSKLSHAIMKVQLLINNFPENLYVKPAFYKSDIEAHIKKTEKAYEWLKTNKGAYELKKVTEICF